MQFTDYLNWFPPNLPSIDQLYRSIHQSPSCYKTEGSRHFRTALPTSLASLCFSIYPLSSSSLYLEPVSLLYSRRVRERGGERIKKMNLVVVKERNKYYMYVIFGVLKPQKGGIFMHDQNQVRE